MKYIAVVDDNEGGRGSVIARQCDGLENVTAMPTMKSEVWHTACLQGEFPYLIFLHDSQREVKGGGNRDPNADELWDNFRERVPIILYTGAAPRGSVDPLNPDDVRQGLRRAVVALNSAGWPQDVQVIRQIVVEAITRGPDVEGVRRVASSLLQRLLPLDILCQGMVLYAENHDGKVPEGWAWFSSCVESEQVQMVVSPGGMASRGLLAFDLTWASEVEWLACAVRAIMTDSSDDAESTFDWLPADTLEREAFLKRLLPGIPLRPSGVDLASFLLRGVVPANNCSVADILGVGDRPSDHPVAQYFAALDKMANDKWRDNSIRASLLKLSPNPLPDAVRIKCADPLTQDIKVLVDLIAKKSKEGAITGKTKIDESTNIVRMATAAHSEYLQICKALAKCTEQDL